MIPYKAKRKLIYIHTYIYIYIYIYICIYIFEQINLVANDIIGILMLSTIKQIVWCGKYKHSTESPNFNDMQKRKGCISEKFIFLALFALYFLLASVAKYIALCEWN